MKRQRMKGVFDPITLAFVLAIVGTAASLTVGNVDKTSQNQPNTSANTVETVAMVRSE